MKNILSVALVLFFVLLIVLTIIIAVQGIFYIIYQKSSRVHLSLLSYCYVNGFFFSLFYRGKQIDSALLFSKYKGHFYVLGIKGIYKFGRCRIKVLLDDDLTEYEKPLIADMKNECKIKLKKYEELLQLASLQYGGE